MIINYCTPSSYKVDTETPVAAEDGYHKVGCSGYVMQTHSFALKNGQLICACGRVKDLDIDINATQKNEIA